jgi:NAD(P)-dependent dehydrogenase (short-subunit alcohol dehydrogenase family)
VERVRSLEKSTIVITGATSGLGRHLADRLAAADAHVVLHGRDPERAERTRAEITAATGNDRVETVLADLASLSQVDRLATGITERCDRIDVLVNNAGVGFGAPGAARQLSADGLELRFAVNYLACYHLTRRLIPLLVTSAPARVVNVASIGQQELDFADPMLERSYDGVTAYRRAKLAQIMFTFDLAEELRDSGVTVTALHPATLMDTAMVHEARTGVRSTVEEGSDATMRLIADPELDRVTGRYFNGTREDRAHRQAYDGAARARLRELTDRLVSAALGT